MTLPLAFDPARHVVGAEHRRLVLDAFAEVHAGGLSFGHNAFALSPWEAGAAVKSVVAAGLVYADWDKRDDPLTPAGLAAHSAAQRALAFLDAAIGA